MTLIVICGGVGLILGLRFKVFVLIPITYAALALVVLNSVAHGDGFGRIALMMFLVATSLQVGYILGNIAGYAAKASPSRASDEGDVSLDPGRSKYLHTLH